MRMMRQRSTNLALAQKSAAELEVDERYQEAASLTWMLQDLTARGMTYTAALNALRHVLADGDSFLDYMLASDVAEYHFWAQSIRSGMLRPR